MPKGLFIKILLIFLPFFSFAQSSYTPVNLPDTGITFYDLIYLKNYADKQAQIIKQLSAKISTYQSKVYKSQQTINALNSRIGLYRNLYASLLRSIYILKTNISSPFLFIFSSKSFNQMLARYTYYKFLTYYVRNLSKYIALLQQELIQNKQILNNYKKSLSVIITDYQNNQVAYDSTVALMLKQTKIMKQNADKIRISINNTYRQYQIIESTIKSMPEQKVQNSDFINLISPLNNSVVISSFGVHSHPELKYVKIKNDGIDLFSRTDTIPKTIATGIVVKVLSIKDKGISVIVKHGEYFSVYSNLNNVFVNQGDTVLIAQPLGTISKTTSKYSFPCLNLQIWHNNQLQNPAEFINFSQ